MLKDLIIPKNCKQKLKIHALVHDSFANNIRNNSSAPSLEKFLEEAFIPVGKAFDSVFGIGLEICYVESLRILASIENPSVIKEDKQKLKEHYAKQDFEEKIILDMICYDYSLSEEERPHFICYLVGEENILPKEIDFYTWPMYIGHRKCAGYSAKRFCCVGINVITNFSSVVQHELSHSLGAEHTDCHNSVMYPSIITTIPGRKDEVATLWDEKNKTIIKQNLTGLGFN